MAQAAAKHSALRRRDYAAVCQHGSSSPQQPSTNQVPLLEHNATGEPRRPAVHVPAQVVPAPWPAQLAFHVADPPCGALSHVTACTKGRAAGRLACSSRCRCRHTDNLHSGIDPCSPRAQLPDTTHAPSLPHVAVGRMLSVLCGHVPVQLLPGAVRVQPGHVALPPDGAAPHVTAAHHSMRSSRRCVRYRARMVMTQQQLMPPHLLQPG